MSWVIDIALLALLLLTAGSIAWTRQLFPAVMLSGIYGLLSASFFVSMDAVDVAFTEAAVGAGVTPLLLMVTMRLVGYEGKQPKGKPVLALLLTLVTTVLLLFATHNVPHFGSPDAPAQQHVGPYYLEESYGDIGIPNVVTSVLASYRGFDTLGEVAVVFIAGVGVLSLLASGGSGSGSATGAPLSRAGMRDKAVLRIVSKILIPPILIFALYVQFHGEYSPGGGFQAGVIFAAAIILYTMLFGLEAATRAISEKVVRILAACGLLLYGTVGVLSLPLGGNYLNYSVLLHDPVHGQHLGIILIELGVGITVASVMILLFFSFVGRVARDGASE